MAGRATLSLLLCAKRANQASQRRAHLPDFQVKSRCSGLRQISELLRSVNAVADFASEDFDVSRNCSCLFG